MILTVQDRNELLKAALKSKDRALAQWLVDIVTMVDDLPDGKNGVICPPYRPPATSDGNPGRHWTETAFTQTLP